MNKFIHLSINKGIVSDKQIVKGACIMVYEMIVIKKIYNGESSDVV